jgi:hypothetical protein
MVRHLNKTGGGSSRYRGLERWLKPPREKYPVPTPLDDL